MTKCRNCGMKIWMWQKWEYPLKEKGKGRCSVLAYGYKHDHGADGVYMSGKNGCMNPQPLGKKGLEEPQEPPERGDLDGRD